MQGQRLQPSCEGNVKRETQVQDKLNTMDRAIDDYSEILGSLIKRLESITRQEPETPSDCCEKESLVVLADVLDTQASRIRALNFRMTTLLQLLELWLTQKEI